MVDHLRLHGVRQLPERHIRERIATQEPTRYLGWVPWWEHRDPYDPTTFRRDLERIERIYRSEGYYSAAIQSTRVEPDPQRRLVNLDVTVREGPPTLVGSIWLSGCEPASRRTDDPWPVPSHTCEHIRRRMRLHLGEVFSEANFDSDRQLIADLLKDAGHADARVTSHATIDPLHHRAHVVFVLDPGPPGYFGTLSIFEGDDEHPARADRLPSGYPVGPIRSAVSIQPGQTYSRTALADAQRRLIELGVFGIVRIVEEPHRCDSYGRCDATRDIHDPRQRVRVDLKVYVTSGTPFRQRFGAGAEISQVQSNVHGLWNFEHRNLFGQMWRLRGELRPFWFLPFVVGRPSSSVQTEVVPFGGAGTIELRRPELLPRLSLVTTFGGDYGPDPINPTHTNRMRLSSSVGAQYRFHREVVGSLFLRGTWLQYLNTDLFLRIDPIFREQYISQIYAYLEQQLTWDGRDDPIQTRRGHYVSAIVHQGAPPSYLFLRGALEGRGYFPLARDIVLAIRGSVGGTIGIPQEGFQADIQQWPVPQELRFYSGGANSNRGYPYYRVGWITTVPIQECIDPSGRVVREGPCPQGSSSRVVPGPGSTAEMTRAQPDERRLTAVGGLAAWELSAEVRWYLDRFGVVLFFDASDVWGWSPPTITQDNQTVMDIPQRPLVASRPGPRTPAPGIEPYRFDPHPSAGVGLRYLSPIGIVRLDVGLRLDDLTCSRFQNQINQILSHPQTAGLPWYFAVSRPRCEVLGFDVPLPLMLNFAIGEAY